MESFTEEHVKSLLSEEWLVKVDGQKSVPYLFKFHHSTMDLSCVILVTDTKSVWTEVLDTRKFARRWRSCNPNSPPPFSDRPEEDSWREASLELLSNAHTLGGIIDISFEVVESNFSDFSFELESEHFRWRWETNFSGYRLSAEIISKQLVLPLICVNHVSLSSPDALSGMPDAEVEKAVDKVGRTARRAIDNHIKSALSKPRAATMIRRITAMFNFVANLPPIFTTAEKPDLEPKVMEQPPMPTTVRPNAPVQHMPLITSDPDPTPSPLTSLRPESKREVPEESETEDEDDHVPSKSLSPERENRDSIMRSPSPASSNSRLKVVSPQPPERESGPEPASTSKKPRLALSSDDEGDVRPSQTTVKRGARQPLKRGGKRF